MNTGRSREKITWVYETCFACNYRYLNYKVRYRSYHTYVKLPPIVFIFNFIFLNVISVLINFFNCKYSTKIFIYTLCVQKSAFNIFDLQHLTRLRLHLKFFLIFCNDRLCSSFEKIWIYERNVAVLKSCISLAIVLSIILVHVNITPNFIYKYMTK